MKPYTRSFILSLIRNRHRLPDHPTTDYDFQNRSRNFTVPVKKVQGVKGFDQINIRVTLFETVFHDPLIGAWQKPIPITGSPDYGLRLPNGDRVTLPEGYRRIN